MTEHEDRMTAFEKQLNAIGDDVRVLKEDVHGLKEDVHGLKEDVHGLKADVRVLKEDVQGLKAHVGGLKDDVHGLKDDVRKLRVLYEHHDTQIRTIADVQAYHGRVLDEHGQLLREIRQELLPLRDLHDFVRRVAEDHERRITSLEKHPGVQ